MKRLPWEFSMALLWGQRALVLLTLLTLVFLNTPSFGVQSEPEEKFDSVTEDSKVGSPREPQTMGLVAGTSLVPAARDDQSTSTQSFPCTLSYAIDGVIGPATYDFMERMDQEAQGRQCSSIFFKLSTPGGSLASTRKIVSLIMNSPLPYLCLVGPAGGHAGSAGAIILQACHVSGALEATNIGAASPVSGNGQDIPETLEKKIFEDTRSWVEGLAKYRERNVEFARDIIMKATALDSREAAQVGGIDTVSSSENDFLDFAEKMKVRVNQPEKTQVVVGALDEVPTDMRYSFLNLFSNPQWAYLLFMASLGLLYFEVTHTGAIVPGVVGLIGLIISMMNFHILHVSWGAVALIIVGLLFMLAELFVTSFGALGIGGVLSLFIGSLFLFEKDLLGGGLPLSIIFAVTLPFSLLMAGMTYLAWSALGHGKKMRAKEKWEGRQGVVIEKDPLGKSGLIRVQGELWKCRSKEPLSVGDQVQVIEKKGLTLEVKLRGPSVL